MKTSNHTFVLALVALTSVVITCSAQGQENSQPQATVTGLGSPGHIAVWKSSSALTSSTIYATGGNVGIGTNTPAAKLEVNGNAQVDGNLSLSGSILENGVGQLLWAPNDGSGNFSVGLSALPSTTTGGANTAVGYGSLSANTSGGGNTATGLNSMLSNTTGDSNTATGYYALSRNTSRSGNTVVGNDALFCNSVGIYNTAIGFAALTGTETTTGNFNIAVGYSAGGSVTGSNNIDIGNVGIASDSGIIRIGTPSTSGCEICQTSAFIAGISGVNISGVPVLVSSTGQLGIASSSRRFKEDIHDMSEVSDRLMQLRPVIFRYTQPDEDGSKPIQYGLIAEEVADVYPDLVARSAYGQIESVRYQLLTPMLLNEIQKQKDQIKSLEERLARIEAMLATGATRATGQ